MNNQFIKSQYNGFRLNGTLASRLTWRGICQIADKSQVTKYTRGDEYHYWVFKDEYGASFSCNEESLADSVVVGERYTCSGEIKVGKGTTFLNLKSAVPFDGSQFKTKEEC